jgi:hypothetical protein
VHLDLARHQADQHAPESHRLGAQPGTDPVASGGRGIPLVEDQVDDLEDGCETTGQFALRGDLERDLLVREYPLGTHDPLRDRGLGDQERPGDLMRGQPADHAQRERRPRLLR